MTPFQQTMLFCFVLCPLVVIVQSFWIVYLFWFYRRGRSSHFQASQQGPQRGSGRSRPPLHATASTVVQMQVGGTAEGQPAQHRSEVKAL